jgi:hypothetical protein
MKHMLMLILALLVAGAMAFILIRYLRKLRKIEDDFWSANK